MKLSRLAGVLQVSRVDRHHATASVSGRGSDLGYCGKFHLNSQVCFCYEIYKQVIKRWGYIKKVKEIGDGRNLSLRGVTSLLSQLK